MILDVQGVTQDGVGLPSSFKPLLRAKGSGLLPVSSALGLGRPCTHRLEPHPGAPTPSQPCLLAPVSPLLLWPRGEQCGGCRRSNTTDRPHAFQVILADRPCLELSAESEAEMADWMQHLCQAVSKGVSCSCLYRSPGLPTPLCVPSLNPHQSWSNPWGPRQVPPGTAQEQALVLSWSPHPHL